MNYRTRNIIMLIIFAGIVFAGWSYTTVNSARFWDDQGNTFPPAFGNINVKGINGLEIDSYQTSDAGCEVIFGINAANIPSIPDEKVKVSSNETAAGYLIAQLIASGRSEITYVETGDGGDETLVTNFNAVYSDITLNDGATDVTSTEFEELSDGSTTSLHGHAGGSPAGADTQVQWNNNGAFGAEAGFTYDDATGIFVTPILSVTGLAVLNESGSDVDTRIESTGISDIFYIDAGDDVVGIGANPTAEVGRIMHVTGDTLMTGATNVTGNLDAGGTMIAIGQVASGDGSTAGSVKLNDGDGETVTIDLPDVLASWTLTLPVAVPTTAGQVIVMTDGAGNTIAGSNFAPEYDFNQALEFVGGDSFMPSGEAGTSYQVIGGTGNIVAWSIFIRDWTVLNGEDTLSVILNYGVPGSFSTTTLAPTSAAQFTSATGLSLGVTGLVQAFRVQLEGTPVNDPDILADISVVIIVEGN